ncbi:MAG TPA: shikimate kinase [Chthoniobacterales bacterium]|jgi:shikimate kinase|nr:shikimate kinase [Chthoniobacterales bacterium]
MKERGDAIVLIGFMGAGKSSVGRTLARMTGLSRFDTDEMVAAQFGLTISEIFEKHGEEKFREAETEALLELSGKGQAIVVTGGGIVLRPENIALLRAMGTIVYLSADQETLFARISRRPTRPLLQTANPRATLNGLLATRLPSYREAADVEVDTSQLKHDEVARTILNRLEEHGRGRIEPQG